MLEQLERQTRLTLNQWKIMIAAILGDMLDFFDYFLIGYVLAFIVHDWNLTYGQSAMILWPRASARSPAPSAGVGWPTRSAAQSIHRDGA